MHTADLFDYPTAPERIELKVGDGAYLFPGYASDIALELIAALDVLVEHSLFRHMETPGGFRMSVAMTNCGEAGWITDRKGYRYGRLDPLTGKPWPKMPDIFLLLAQAASLKAGYPGFTPDACLVNSYVPGARMSLHQDKNEKDASAPIVSVSLGLPATFLFGGLSRSDKPQRYMLHHGDVVVWGGATRFNFHGIAPLKHDTHSLLGNRRINLTFRRT